MVKPLSLFACLCSLAGLVVSPARGGDAFPLRDGDRVVLVGNTLIEREQRYGYWETALTCRHPNRNVTFRNLGWSGDTVFGEARAGFGSVTDGFRELKDHVLALKPTVLIVGYGSNEAFAGSAGLPRFVQGLKTLLDTLATTKARVVLLSPLRQEDLGRPLPDPTAHNKDLRLYADAIRAVAKERGHRFVDLYDLLGDGTRAKPPAPLTDNGIHLTAWGYWRSAPALERGLGLDEPRWHVEIDADGKVLRAEGVRVEKGFRITDAMLPLPPAPEGGPAVHTGARMLRVHGLAPGRHTLLIDSKPITTATSEEWAAGVRLERGPEFEQAERLREAVRAKNRLYFHRWRPQNVTYLFGFRKQEQGQNAREIPQFDPLVARKEAEIARLRVPVPHTYQFKKN